MHNSINENNIAYTFFTFKSHYLLKTDAKVLKNILKTKHFPKKDKKNGYSNGIFVYLCEICNKTRLLFNK